MKILNPCLYIGLGSAVYALVKTDGQLHLHESLKARIRLVEEPHGELAMQSFQMREHYQTTIEDAYSFAMSCFASHRNELNAATRKYLVKVVEKIAEADEQVSGKEIAFIRRFRRDIRKI
ncbi:TerB family tellurite resistance protein [Runella sp.]|jgi:uncharacterized tellurite resistance protein B-like protein|uniref:TerB family tellurite resistance protein n=1 Tax=Runella sp. TaxID=1960881 RepID=UPI002605FBAB|nr:TerB family tellurite resistance protein [Runella sp.]